MMTQSEKVSTYGFVWFLCVVMGVLYYVFFINRAYVEVTLDVDEKTDFKIYWADEGQGFSEKRMGKVRVNPDRRNYSFSLTDLHNVARLRIDPHQYVGFSSIERVTISQKGFRKIELEGADFARLEPLEQLERYGVTEKGLAVYSTGKDPNFLYIPAKEKQRINYLECLVQFAFIICLVHLIYFSARHLNKDLRYIPYLLTGVLLLVTTMAFISEVNVHPDEFVHVAASDYYTDHWLPPQIESEDIAGTYSPYGVSRLNTDEIYYLLDGKFTRIVEMVHLNNFYSDRLFNLFLLFLIVLYTLKNVIARFVAVPFILSPQIWYTFSYCNSDAFALFVAYIAGCQIVDRDSTFYRFLTGGRWLRWLARGAALAVLFGLLFLTKKNYYPYVAFVFFIVLLDFWRNFDPQSWKTLCVRLLVVSLVGLSLMAMKNGADYMVNGADRDDKIRAMQIEKAHYLYHPDTPLELKHPYLYMRDRGISLESLVVVERWFEKTFRSAFGVYGYFTISAPYTYYDLVRWTGLALLSFFLLSIFLRGGWIASLQVGAVLALSSALIGISLYHSWVSDFQAQGRYLFPIASMLAVLFAQTKDYVNQKYFSIGVVAMFLLSSYSFINIALRNIPRIVFN